MTFIFINSQINAQSLIIILQCLDIFAQRIIYGTDVIVTCSHIWMGFTINIQLDTQGFLMILQCLGIFAQRIIYGTDVIVTCSHIWMGFTIKF